MGDVTDRHLSLDVVVQARELVIEFATHCVRIEEDDEARYAPLSIQFASVLA